ncbi:MAG: indolepyruvate oxidoreductase subunit beta [Deltaproteobacteria bacterium]|nr:indolepyruvate oxidoreductase subunit beta [Deltaproteobacteria bacterium]
MTSKTKMETINIILAGVGGQGSITSGQIAARAALLAGKGVVMSEVHGMAQRGGSVMSTVRYGSAQSPVVSLGEADFLLGFEKLEALRYSPYLRPNGIAIVSNQQIIPTIEALKKISYPTDIENRLAASTGLTIIVPALEIAETIGNPRLVGTVILGVFSAFLTIPATDWAQALGEIVPAKTISLNLQAFETGADFSRGWQLANNYQRTAQADVTATPSADSSFFESA